MRNGRATACLSFSGVHMSETILLTHTRDMRRNYYGDRAVAGLGALGWVRFPEAAAPLAGASLIAAAQGCRVIVSDRQTPGDAEIFAALPDLVAFVRCAVDIRNVAVAVASEHGVLVTHASPGFVASVAELVLGYMVDLARHVTPAATAYHGGAPPTALRGLQLRVSTLGILGYGAIGRYLADLGVALGMNVLVDDPYARVDKPGIAQGWVVELVARADFVGCLVVANEATENLMNEAAFALMKPSAYFINVSRGNLVDEAALARALEGKHIVAAALDVCLASAQMPPPERVRLSEIFPTLLPVGVPLSANEHNVLVAAALC